MRVLLVDDDPIQVAIATSWLREHGHAVTSLQKGSEAIIRLQRDTFDIVVLDWMMPELSGEDLLRWIRQRHARLPVMFATAKDEEEEIASMLRLGADDYVVKPLRRLEFLARVDALGRRAGLIAVSAEDILELGPYRIDATAKAIALHAQPVKMTPRMTEVAILLFRKCGELVSRTQLYEQFWGRTEAVDTRTVDTHVSRIRHALELDGRHGFRLSAVYQHGYRLERVSGT